MKTNIFVLLLSAVLMSFNACKKDNTQNCVDGNGDVVQEQRDVGNFINVQTDGAYKVFLYQGAKTQVDLFAESNIIPLIQTSVVNQTLVVKVQDGQCYNTNNPVEVSIVSPEFEVVSFNGAGDIAASNLVLDKLTFNLNGAGGINSGLDLQDFTLNIVGAGNANIVGTGKVGHIIVSGAGNVYATNFFQETVYVSISGTGDARIYVTKLLDVTITGSGSVYYEGNPETVNTKITGSGVVEPI